MSAITAICAPKLDC